MNVSFHRLGVRWRRLAATRARPRRTAKRPAATCSRRGAPVTARAGEVAGPGPGGSAGGGGGACWAAAMTVRFSTWVVHIPPVSQICTVRSQTPAAVAAPLHVPSASNVSPGGTVPPTTE